jgi:hypothetical protein
LQRFFQWIWIVQLHEIVGDIHQLDLFADERNTVNTVTCFMSFSSFPLGSIEGPWPYLARARPLQMAVAVGGRVPRMTVWIERMYSLTLTETRPTRCISLCDRDTYLSRQLAV